MSHSYPAAVAFVVTLVVVVVAALTVRLYQWILSQSVSFCLLTPFLCVKMYDGKSFVFRNLMDRSVLFNGHILMYETVLNTAVKTMFFIFLLFFFLLLRNDPPNLFLFDTFVIY